MSKCIKCEKEYADDMEFCPYCGTKKGGVSENKKDDNTRLSVLKLLPIILISIAAIAAICVGIKLFIYFLPINQINRIIDNEELIEEDYAKLANCYNKLKDEKDKKEVRTKVEQIISRQKDEFYENRYSYENFMILYNSVVPEVIDENCEEYRTTSVYYQNLEDIYQARCKYDSAEKLFSDENYESALEIYKESQELFWKHYSILSEPDKAIYSSLVEKYKNCEKEIIKIYNKRCEEMLVGEWQIEGDMSKALGIYTVDKKMPVTLSYTFDQNKTGHFKLTRESFDKTIHEYLVDQAVEELERKRIYSFISEEDFNNELKKQGYSNIRDFAEKEMSEYIDNSSDEINDIYEALQFNLEYYVDGEYLFITYNSKDVSDEIRYKFKISDSKLTITSSNTLSGDVFDSLSVYFPCSLVRIDEL